MTDIARTAATQTQVLALELGLTDSAKKEIIQKHLVAMLAMERERANDLAEVLSLIDGEGIRAGINAPEDAEVGALCERIGYGAVMDAAARLWFRKDPHGALTVGPCALTVREVRSEQ